MISTLSRDFAVAPATEFPAPLRRILLATAGESTTTGALRLARELSERRGARVSALTVYQPPVPLPLLGGEEPRLESAQQDELNVQQGVVRRQIAEVAGRDAEWPLHIRVGEHGRCILEEAARGGVDLILLGIGRVHTGERSLGDRALLRVAYGADRPIMAVCPSLEHLPRVVVLAVGQHGETVRLARMVAAVAAPGAAIHLVHVEEPGEPAELLGRRDGLLQHVATELDRGGFHTVRQQIRRGDPMRRVLAYARRNGAELIVGGLHGEGFAARTVVRNMVLHLAAVSKCSVLMVPRAEP